MPPDAEAGSGRIACGLPEPPQLRVRGALVELVEKGDNRRTRTLAEAEPALTQRFGGARLPLRWARLSRPPAENTAEALLAAIEEVRPGFGSPPWERVNGGLVSIAGAVFVEEVHQGETEDTWVFAVRFRVDRGPQQSYLVHGDRLSREDIEARLPGYVRLGQRVVAMTGLGGLGGELAIELAKAGIGTLRGLDYDTVEAGTTVRWVGGLTAVGHPKIEYLRQRIGFDYPYTTFEPFPLQLGGSAAPARARGESELEVLDRFLDECDLLIDTSAEIGVQQALAYEAGARGLRQIFVSSTEGARGGMVARLDPGRGGCWHCLQMHLDEETIPLPAHAEPLTLQPRGCGSLTYRGAGFDLLPIVAQATRVAAATLSEGPDSQGSIAYVCDFTSERLSPPSWSEHSIEAHPECPACGDGKS